MIQQLQLIAAQRAGAWQVLLEQHHLRILKGHAAVVACSKGHHSCLLGALLLPKRDRVSGLRLDDLHAKHALFELALPCCSAASGAVNALLVVAEGAAEDASMGNSPMTAGRAAE